MAASVPALQPNKPPGNSNNAQLSAADLADQQLVNNFEVPQWAGKPPSGLHLDVLKEGKLIQKLMIDEKKCYFFGRNRQLCDFPIEHASSSRVHAALVWHRALCRPFLIDLGSTHGTFIGEHIRLEASKPQQIPPDSQIHFGASQRIYVIRERPFTATLASAVSNASAASQSGGSLKSGIAGNNSSSSGSAALGLPEDETELDNLTEYNTAHNRRIASLPINDQSKLNPKRQRKKLKSITFCEEEQVINPEDVDPNVGRFRNLCRTVVVPSKRPRTAGPLSSPSTQSSVQFFGPGATAHSHKVDDSRNEEPHIEEKPSSANSALSVLQNPLYSSAAKLFNIAMPNLAPSLDEPEPRPVMPVTRPDIIGDFEVQAYGELTDEMTDPTNIHGAIKRKKYAKEAWPGKKPTGALLV